MSGGAPAGDSPLQLELELVLQLLRLADLVVVDEELPPHLADLGVAALREPLHLLQVLLLPLQLRREALGILQQPDLRLLGALGYS